MKKLPNNEYYYFNRNGNTILTVLHHHRNKMGVVLNNTLYCPKELIGKKIRLKIEIVEEEDNIKE